MADVNLTGGGGWIALVLFVIYFYGDPDIHDLVVELVSHLRQETTP